MSDTNLTLSTTALPTDKLLTPQSVMGYGCLVIGAASIAAAFILGDAQMRGMALAGGLAALTSGTGFYLGSSKGSADKTTATNNQGTTLP